MLILTSDSGSTFTEYDYRPSIKFKLQCPLCTFEGITEHRYEDDKWIIAKCKSCDQWMIVLRPHRAYVTRGEYSRALHLMRKLIGPGRCRPYMGHILDHWHCHWLQ